VLDARCPAEARALCEERGTEIDLLLTDVIMPECTGPQLAQELMELYPHLRVLYMSGYPGGASDRAGALRPDAPYIEKPFSPDSLVTKIRALMSVPR
jgi:two-component system, cell cycle sensor histidine kinase and response regulator CckA